MTREPVGMYFYVSLRHDCTDKQFILLFYYCIILILFIYLEIQFIVLGCIIYVTRSIGCVGLFTGRDAFSYCPYSCWDSGCSRFRLGVGAKWD